MPALGVPGGLEVPSSNLGAPTSQPPVRRCLFRQPRARGLKERADAVDEHGDLVRQQREGDDDRRRDDAEDDRVLGHRLSAFASVVGSNAVEPARGSHIPKDRRGRAAPVCLVLGIRPE